MWRVSLLAQGFIKGVSTLSKENDRFMEHICCATAYDKANKSQKKKVIKKK